MPVKLFFPAFLLLASFFLPAHGQSETVTGSNGVMSMYYPPDKTAMEFGILNISLKIPRGSADVLNIQVNNEESWRYIPDREFVCFHVFLNVGINSIQISAMKKNKETDNLAFSVFRRSDLESKNRKPPEGYKRDHFHMKRHPECAECHTLEPGISDRKPVSIDTFAGVVSGEKETVTTASTCYSCHKAITSYKYVHGPASVWSCLSCHDPQGIPVYSVRKPDTDVCFGCHTEQEHDWGSKEHIHGPLNTGRCAICHNPHASENPFNLFKPTWELCISCHAEKAAGSHVLVGYIYEGHPTRGVPDPLRQGKELTCASCHNPHASNYPYLWSLSVGTLFELCKKCHKY
jgi:predicted CXXCH cytochrome family protein